MALSHVVPGWLKDFISHSKEQNTYIVSTGCQRLLIDMGQGIPSRPAWSRLPWQTPRSSCLVFFSLTCMVIMLEAIRIFLGQTCHPRYKHNVIIVTDHVYLRANLYTCLSLQCLWQPDHRCVLRSKYPKPRFPCRPWAYRRLLSPHQHIKDTDFYILSPWLRD